MPSSPLMEMHAHMLRTTGFGCGFNREAIRVSISRGKYELKNTVNRKCGALSVKDATELLAKLQVSLEAKMQSAQEATQNRHKASLMVLKDGD